MKLFNKINGGAKLFSKMNDSSNIFSKYSQKPSLSNAVAKVGHFIANKNNHLERSVRNSKEEQGPIYK